MPLNINKAQIGCFFKLETTPGTAVALANADYRTTVSFKQDPNQLDKDTVTLDSLARPADVTAIKNRYTKASMQSIVAWAAAAPAIATASTLLPDNDFMQVCGAAAPVAVAAVAGPPAVAAHVLYNELADLSTMKAATLSGRRPAGSQQVSRTSAGTRGVMGFEWEIGKRPYFSYEMTGMHSDIALLAALTGTPNSTGLAAAAASANTGSVLINGQALCLYKMSAKNLWRVKQTIALSLCGTGTNPMPDNAEFTIQFKMPNLTTEFNPDVYLGNQYPFQIVVKGENAYAARSLDFSWLTLEVRDAKEVDLPDDSVGVEMTLGQVSPLALRHF